MQAVEQLRKERVYQELDKDDSSDYLWCLHFQLQLYDLREDLLNFVRDALNKIIEVDRTTDRLDLGTNNRNRWWILAIERGWISPESGRNVILIDPSSLILIICYSGWFHDDIKTEADRVRRLRNKLFGHNPTLRITADILYHNNIVVSEVPATPRRFSRYLLDPNLRCIPNPNATGPGWIYF